jgi:hypothetical protein
MDGQDRICNAPLFLFKVLKNGMICTSRMKLEEKYTSLVLSSYLKICTFLWNSKYIYDKSSGRSVHEGNS